MGFYLDLREKIRVNPWVAAGVYLNQSLIHSNFGRLLRKKPHAQSRPNGVALCLRFRDEAAYLAEWIEYHTAAGVDHFFLYNNYSTDNFSAAIAGLPASLVTLVDWSRTPASPSAEEDCIGRAIGRFEWVGFLDADEFVVVRDGRSIANFLVDYKEYPAVALHWRYFGSNGHKRRPTAGVVVAYTRAAAADDKHVKCFVDPPSSGRVQELSLVVFSRHEKGRE